MKIGVTIFMESRKDRAQAIFTAFKFDFIKELTCRPK
jgi:hypothetical protein